MICVVTPENRHLFKEELKQHFQARYKVFYLEKKWDLPVKDGFEIDEFDREDVTYLLYRETFEAPISGGVRLIRTDTVHMFTSLFAKFLRGNEYQPSEMVWEASRIFVDKSRLESSEHKNAAGRATIEIMIAMNEFALSQGIELFVTLSEPKIIRLSKIMNWEIKPFYAPIKYKEDPVAPCQLYPSQEALKNLRQLVLMPETPITWNALPIQYRFDRGKPVLNYGNEVPQVGC